METLHYQDVTLKLNEYIDYIKGWSPYYIFDIYIDDSKDSIGHITFRLGSDDEHEFDGHIGYSIDESYRGHYYAYQSCLALEHWICDLGYEHVIITCSPDNIASKKTIEKLNAAYIETKLIPSYLKKDFTETETHKSIYHWQLHKT